MKQTILKLLFLSDEQLTKSSKKLAFVNLIIGILFIAATIFIYLFDISPKINSLTDTLNKAAEQIVSSPSEKKIESASYLLTACSEFVTTVSPYFALLIMSFGLFSLFTAIMYYRIYVLLNKNNT